MKLVQHPLFDALCGEYLLGAMRGAARRRFERQCQQDPLAARRLAEWERVHAASYRTMPAVQKVSPAVWKRIEATLELRHRADPATQADQGSWLLRWFGFRSPLGAAALVVGFLLVVMVGMLDLRPRNAAFAQISVQFQGEKVNMTLAGIQGAAPQRFAAPLAKKAGPEQSYEVWLVPANGAAPQSIKVFKTLIGVIEVSPELEQAIQAGGKLAVSLEPFNGSPNGKPTEVIGVLEKV